MVKVIEARGTHFEIGQQLGEQCKDIGIKINEQFKKTWSDENITVQEAIDHSKKFLPYAKKFYINYLDEITGYAKAAGLLWAEMFAWFCYDPPVTKGCTDFILSHRITENKNTYIVHNEDYSIEEEDYIVLAKIFPDDEPAFMSMTYGGIWFNAGVNTVGIGVAGNGLSYNDAKIGIPADFTFRKILSAKTLGEAMEYSTPADRCGSYNNMIADDNGEMYAMEASATDYAAIHGRDFIVHTNHYLSPKMEKYDAAFQHKGGRSPGYYSDSVVRYHRALNLIKDSLKTGIKMDTRNIKDVLEDHVNLPWALCRHADERQPEKERSKTIFSQIINLNERSMLICKGNPCTGKWEKHTL